MNLEELIDQQINLGHKDPHTYPELLRKALGNELITILEPYLDDFISEAARHRISNLRRQSVAKITTASLGDPQIMLRSMWVPTNDGHITYKPIGDMTADDFDARATYLEHMAHGIHVSAQWCRDVAKAIRDQGVKTAKKLTNLPPLPDIE